jgi:hypothetical protein
MHTVDYQRFITCILIHKTILHNAAKFAYLAEIVFESVELDNRLRHQSAAANYR